jgi:hypothetical protein
MTINSKPQTAEQLLAMLPNQCLHCTTGTPSESRSWFRENCPKCNGSGIVKHKPSYRPFSNGTAFMQWTEGNCERCWKSKVSETTQRSRCPMENAIARGACGDGTIPQRIAKRLGWDGRGSLVAECPEREEHRPKTQKKTPNQPELL